MVCCLAQRHKKAITIKREQAGLGRVYKQVCILDMDGFGSGHFAGDFRAQVQSVLGTLVGVVNSSNAAPFPPCFSFATHTVCFHIIGNLETMHD